MPSNTARWRDLLRRVAIAFERGDDEQAQVARAKVRDFSGYRLHNVVNDRVAQRLENPTVDPDAVYNERSDQWSVPRSRAGH